MATQTHLREKSATTVVDSYDVTADAKKRIGLRDAKTRHFHVLALSDGRYLLEPRILVPPEAVSPRTLRMLEKSMRNLKQGVVGKAVDLSGL